MFENCYVFVRGLNRLSRFLKHAGNLLNITRNATAGLALFGCCRCYIAHIAKRYRRRFVNLAKGITGFAGQVHTCGDLWSYRTHAVHDACCVMVDSLDHSVDLVGSLSCTFGQFSNFIGDNGKAAALFTGPRSLDRRVEGEKIGLIGNFLDDTDDAADLA